MSGAIRLLLIDNDAIYRTGLCVLLEQYTDIVVIAADSDPDALQILTQSDRLSVDLVILALDLDGSNFHLVEQLKTTYPNLPILLLGSVSAATQLSTAKAMGVEGYCPKGIAVSQLIAIARQLVAGQSYWTTDIATIPTSGILTTIRENWRLSGLQQIDSKLAEVIAQLQIPGLTVLERAILAGQQRELLASRWLVNQLLKPSIIENSQGIVTNIDAMQVPSRHNLALLPAQISSNSQLTQASANIFTAVQAKIQFSLNNLTGVPLEIDIFRAEKKRELLATVLSKIGDIVAQLRYAQVKLEQLPKMEVVILQDLWQMATIDYFGKYSTILVGEQNIEIASYLLQDAAIVRAGILNKIPLVIPLFAYLLFDTPLVVDNVAYSVGSPEALARAEIILQNLVIEIANAVVQPLLNKLADVEIVKQSFYDRSLISSREIERFRNNLSWKYRFQAYINEPKLVFESQYQLFIFAERGIARVPIYAPRNQELQQLSGIPAIVTLALEFRDAIAPRLRAAVAFLGSGVVYVLTQVIGRAIGLIGRGILQGIGGSIQPDKLGKDSKKFK